MAGGSARDLSPPGDAANRPLRQGGDPFGPGVPGIFLRRGRRNVRPSTGIDSECHEGAAADGEDRFNLPRLPMALPEHHVEGILVDPRRWGAAGVDDGGSVLEQANQRPQVSAFFHVVLSAITPPIGVFVATG